MQRNQPAASRSQEVTSRTVSERVKPPTTAWERKLARSGYRYVVGLDEAGRGAWAGPVFAGAVVLPESRGSLVKLRRCVRDSKLLAPQARAETFELILSLCPYAGVGAASAKEIDEYGIASATRLAWIRAIEDTPEADFLLLDAFPLTESSLPQMPIVRGDSTCLSIAAASIVAKVARDRFMTELASKYPVYGFDCNKGYGTRFHQDALASYGPCELHRRSFAPISRAAAQL